MAGWHRGRVATAGVEAGVLGELVTPNSLCTVVLAVLEDINRGSSRGWRGTRGTCGSVSDLVVKAVGCGGLL